jgi:hypothetical protein
LEEDDKASEATHNAEHSAFSPRSMNEDELSPHNEEHVHEVQLQDEHLDSRNGTPMSKDSIEPEHEVQNVEPQHHEFEEQTPLQENRQFVEEEHEPVHEQPESPNSQMNASVYQKEEYESNLELPIKTAAYEHSFEHEPVQHDFEPEPVQHDFEPAQEHPESPVQHDLDQEPTHYEQPESPSVQMQTSVYQQQEEEPIQHNFDRQSIQHDEFEHQPESPNSQMSKSFSHQQEEQESAHPEDEVASVKNYHQEHRDSFAESESEPNLHYQSESIQPVESKSEEVEHQIDENRFQQNFDLSNDNSIPVMEGSYTFI